MEMENGRTEQMVCELVDGKPVMVDRAGNVWTPRDVMTGNLSERTRVLFEQFHRLITGQDCPDFYAIDMDPYTC